VHAHQWQPFTLLASFGEIPRVYGGRRPEGRLGNVTAVITANTAQWAVIGTTHTHTHGIVAGACMDQGSRREGPVSANHRAVDMDICHLPAPYINASWIRVTGSDR